MKLKDMINIIVLVKVNIFGTNTEHYVIHIELNKLGYCKSVINLLESIIE